MFEESKRKFKETIAKMQKAGITNESLKDKLNLATKLLKSKHQKHLSRSV